MDDLQLSKYWSNICHPMGGPYENTLIGGPAAWTALALEVGKSPTALHGELNCPAVYSIAIGHFRDRFVVVLGRRAAANAQIFSPSSSLPLRIIIRLLLLALLLLLGARQPDSSCSDADAPFFKLARAPLLHAALTVALDRRGAGRDAVKNRSRRASRAPAALRYRAFGYRGFCS